LPRSTIFQFYWWRKPEYPEKASDLSQTLSHNVVWSRHCHEREHYNLPAEAICSLVFIGWNPTNGICIDNINPTMKNDVYAAKKTNIVQQLSTNIKIYSNFHL
jgi:hypothetical protein